MQISAMQTADFARAAIPPLGVGEPTISGVCSPPGTSWLLGDPSPNSGVVCDALAIREQVHRVHSDG